MWKKGRKIEGVSASSFVEFRSLLYEKQADLPDGKTRPSARVRSKKKRKGLAISVAVGDRNSDIGSVHRRARKTARTGDSGALADDWLKRNAAEQDRALEAHNHAKAARREKGASAALIGNRGDTAAAAEGGRVTINDEGERVDAFGRVITARPILSKGSLREAEEKALRRSEWALRQKARAYERMLADGGGSDRPDGGHEGATSRYLVDFEMKGWNDRERRYGDRDDDSLADDRGGDGGPLGPRRGLGYTPAGVWDGSRDGTGDGYSRANLDVDDKGVSYSERRRQRHAELDAIRAETAAARIAQERRRGSRRERLEQRRARIAEKKRVVALARAQGIM